MSMKHFSRLAALSSLLAVAVTVTGPGGLGMVPAALAVGTPLAPPAVYGSGVWQGKGTAVVRVLDRLDAHVEVISVPAGTTAHYKSLDITAGRCLERPKTLSPDAAGWLELHDTHPDGATFKGWMLAAERGWVCLKALSMMCGWCGVRGRMLPRWHPLCPRQPCLCWHRPGRINPPLRRVLPVLMHRLRGMRPRPLLNQGENTEGGQA